MPQITFNNTTDYLATSDDTQTLLTSFDFATFFFARDISLFYALVDALGSAVTAHLADPDAHPGGADTAAAALIQPTPDSGDLWRYFLYLNSLRDAILDHATRPGPPSNVHASADNASFALLPTLDPATDIESGVLLANTLKSELNTHFGNLVAHSNTTMPVDAVDAVDDAYYPGVGQATINVSALDATNHKGRVWKYDVGYKSDSAGAVTLIGIPESTLDLRDTPEADDWDVTVDADGSTLRVRATGTLTQTITWLGRTQLQTIFVTP